MSKLLICHSINLQQAKVEITEFEPKAVITC